MATRRASHAGSWYTGNGQKLDKELDNWLNQVPNELKVATDAVLTVPNSTTRAIIAPHAGYSYSGPTAAWAYKSIDPTNIDTVFILGPSHHVYLDGCATSICSYYETPLGNLTIDKKITGELQATKLFSQMSVDVDEDEHSIEMHLPYVYKMMQGKQFTIVPILVGSINNTKENKYGEVLAPYLKNPRNLFVISSDFCHWGSRFRYQYSHPECSNLPIYQQIDRLDHDGMALIEALDVNGFANYLKKTQNTICGRHPIGVLLNAIHHAYPNALPHLHFTRYAQSSSVTAKNDSSVSYASAVVYQK